jgi:uncharacterized tellurite resistance protein B-like protein
MSRNYFLWSVFFENIALFYRKKIKHKMERANKKQQLNVLIQLAKADKHFAASEREMIFFIGKQWGFSEQEMNALVCSPEPLGALGSGLSAEQKFEHLSNCVALIHQDHKLFETELVFCKSIAIKLGFKKSAVDFLGNVLKNGWCFFD